MDYGKTDIRGYSYNRSIPLMKYHASHGFIYSIEWVSGNTMKIIMHGQELLTEAECILSTKPVLCFISNTGNAETQGNFIVEKITNRAVYINNPNASDDTYDETFATAPTEGDDTFTIGLIDFGPGYAMHGAYNPVGHLVSPVTIKRNLLNESIEYVYNTQGNFYFEIGKLPTYVQIRPITGSCSVELKISTDGVHYTNYDIWSAYDDSGANYTDSEIPINSTSGPFTFALQDGQFPIGAKIKIRVKELTDCTYSVSVLN